MDEQAAGAGGLTGYAGGAAQSVSEQAAPGGARVVWQSDGVQRFELETKTSQRGNWVPDRGSVVDISRDPVLAITLMLLVFSLTAFFCSGRIIRGSLTWCRVMKERRIIALSVTVPGLAAVGAKTMDDEAVIAAMRQWIERAVIGLNLCPFAKAVYVKNQVRFVVSHAPHLDGLLEDLDRELEFLAAADQDAVDTTLLVHTTLLSSFLDFNDFMQLAEAAVEEHDLQGVIQVASFHPTFQFEGTQPGDIGNFTNWAPFPTLHLLREASIERAVAAFPEAETIYERNIEKLEALGHAGWKTLWSRS